MADINSKRREFDLDLRHGQAVEGAIANLLLRTLIEVKNDRRAARSGNICVEFCQFGSNGQYVKSGINVTTASWWAIHWHEDPNDGPVLLVPTKLLKELCRVYMKDPSRVKVTGDNGNKSVLIPVAALLPGNALHRE